MRGTGVIIQAYLYPIVCIPPAYIMPVICPSSSVTTVINHRRPVRQTSRQHGADIPPVPNISSCAGQLADAHPHTSIGLPYHKCITQVRSHKPHLVWKYYRKMTTIFHPQMLTFLRVHPPLPISGRLEPLTPGAAERYASQRTLASYQTTPSEATTPVTWTASCAHTAAKKAANLHLYSTHTLGKP